MTSISIAFLLIQAVATENAVNPCDDAKSLRQKDICEVINKVNETVSKIETSDKMAIGTSDEMFSIKLAARSCGVANRVDFLDENTSIFIIYNATENQKKCVRDWLDINLPNQIYSPDKVNDRINKPSQKIEDENVCDDPETQSQMTICSYRNYRLTNERLNKQFKITYTYMKSVDANFSDDGRLSHIDILWKAQNDWAAYRYNHCISVAYKYRGGSAESMFHNLCLTEQTERRIKELKSLMIEG